MDDYDPGMQEVQKGESEVVGINIFSSKGDTEKKISKGVVVVYRSTNTQYTKTYYGFGVLETVSVWMARKDIQN